MSAVVLPKPGARSLDGQLLCCPLGLNGEYPNCGHRSCEQTFGMANSRCRFCGRRVGYGVRFYQDGGELVHAVCAEEDVEEVRARADALRRMGGGKV